MAAAVVARPENAAAAMDDDAKGMKRHRDRVDERSPDAKRCRRDDSHYYRVSSSSAAGRKRKRDDVRDCSRRDIRRRRPRYSSPSRGSCTRRSHVRRTPKRRNLDERAQGSKRRRRSRSPPSEPKSRQLVIPCTRVPQAQPQTLPVSAAALADIQQPLQDLTEQFEETELRRRETARKREEARREMDKVTQSVYFDDPFVSLKEILKYC